MTLRKMLIGIVSGLLLPAVVGAQPAPDELVQRGRRAGVDVALLQEVRQRAAQQGLSNEQTVMLMQPPVEMAEGGLPSQQVLRKALEGMAKRVPPGRVAGVLTQMQQHTGQASQLVDPWLQKPEVTSMMGGKKKTPEARALLVENLAQALMQRVPQKTVEVLLERLPAQVRGKQVPAAELGAAIGILGDLPTARSAPRATAELVASALNAGFDQVEMRRLPAAVQAAGKQGKVPAEVVARRAAEQMRSGTPAAEVLSGLFREGIPAQGPPPGVGPDRKGPPGDRGQGQGGPPDQQNPPGGGKGQGQGQGRGNAPSQNLF